MQKTNLKVVYRLAWSFHKTSRVDFDDLFQEAAIAALEGEKSYKPEKGKQVTHIYQVVMNRLIDFIRREAKYHLTFILPDEELDHPVQNSLFFDFYNSLSKSGRDVVDTVMENKEEILINQKKARGIVRKKLREKGCSYEKAGEKIRRLKVDLQKM